MELKLHSVPAVTKYYGETDLTLEGNTHLKLQAHGAPFLNVQVPAGKVWRVHINMEIVEDAE